MVKFSPTRISKEERVSPLRSRGEPEEIQTKDDDTVFHHDIATT